MPWLLALLLATLVAVPVGALIAIPAIRISGVFLALATLGFGILVEEVFYTRELHVRGSPLGRGPATGRLHRGLEPLHRQGLLLPAVGDHRVGRGRSPPSAAGGWRLLEAMADSPLALETHGATSSVLEVIVFCIAAAMASLAGALTGMLYHYGVGTYFPSFNSLTLVALVMIITMGDPWYAVIGAMGYTVIPGYSRVDTTNGLKLLFGLGAVAAATARGAGPSGVPAEFLDRFGGRKAVGRMPTARWRRVGRGSPALAARRSGPERADGVEVATCRSVSAG